MTALAIIVAFAAGILIAGYRPRVFHALDWGLTYATLVPLSVIGGILWWLISLVWYCWDRLSTTTGRAAE